MVGGIILRRERGRGGQGVAYPCGLAVVTATLWAPPGLSPRRLARRLDRVERRLIRAGGGAGAAAPGFPLAG